jgi:hypothetical protein
MAGKQKSGGGAKKYGRNKVKCERYKREGRRELNKLDKFKKNNISKDSTEDEKNKKIAEFKLLQSDRKKGKKV